MNTTNTMNIVLLTSGALRNPKESAHLTTISYARELQKRGHRVMVITERKKGMPPEKMVAGIPFFHPYNLGILNKILSHPLALRSLQKKYAFKVEVIHSFSASPWFALNTFLAGRWARKAKKIHTLRSYPRQGGRLWGTIFLNLLDGVTVPTIIFAQKLWSVPTAKVTVVHSPIDLKKFFPKEAKDKLALKKKYGYDGKKVVLYYGAMTDNKGMPLLFQVILQIVRQRNDVQFLFLPRHHRIEQWADLIKSLGIGEYAKIIPIPAGSDALGSDAPRNAPIEDYVNLADAVVLPYSNLWGTDGNPSCLLEALACGTPVVTTDFPELREIAAGAVEFAKANDVREFTEKLQQVLDQPDRHKIRKGLEIVKSFAPEIVAERMGEVYASLPE